MMVDRAAEDHPETTPSLISSLPNVTLPTNALRIAFTEMARAQVARIFDGGLARWEICIGRARDVCSAGSAG
jgi:hypothetical protein